MYQSMTGRNETLTCKWSEEKEECKNDCKLANLGWGHPVAVVQVEHLKDHIVRISFVQMSSVKSKNKVPYGRGIWKKLDWHVDEEDKRSPSLFHVPHVYHLDFTLDSASVFGVWPRVDPGKPHNTAKYLQMTDHSLSILKVWVGLGARTDYTPQSNTIGQQSTESVLLAWTSTSWFCTDQASFTNNSHEMTVAGTSTTTSTATDIPVVTPAATPVLPTTLPFESRPTAEDDDQSIEMHSLNPKDKESTQTYVTAPSLDPSWVQSPRGHVGRLTIPSPPVTPEAVHISATDANSIAEITKVLCPATPKFVSPSARHPRHPRSSLSGTAPTVIPRASSMPPVSTRDTTNSANTEVRYNISQHNMVFESNQASKRDLEAANGRSLPEIRLETSAWDFTQSMARSVEWCGGDLCGTFRLRLRAFACRC
ncbi:hypothetical protein BKA65DRAFT_547828 [Rhexocercosporidium sp. MPI-PUGE-AT-0058]|nr:hypothetical protein BKA65DRAFT_547828 [Rhexocercosporidium sp. MPI-PUGE-AT-0058]